MSINSTLVIPAGTDNGGFVCARIQTFDNLFFQKSRRFSVHIGLLELDRGIVIQDFYASVYIYNNDRKFFFDLE